MEILLGQCPSKISFNLFSPFPKREGVARTGVLCKASTPVRASGGE